MRPFRSGHRVPSVRPRGGGRHPRATPAIGDFGRRRTGVARGSRSFSNHNSGRLAMLATRSGRGIRPGLRSGCAGVEATVFATLSAPQWAALRILGRFAWAGPYAV